ncbi:MULTISPECIES: thiol:disulfide interchange protein DsbA/DsbL [Campylobacter]|uniref:thiol:disulfide interchange protein DsbA/DsbL n=1 Tax=Campylobacter TaxID=194 RepID=UPI00146FF48E|nr:MULTISPECIES: thiol:disulfide interchange protein DsbA/DsbL [Campylobacter]MBN7288714.1 thiol:disulfide interchange protein DsbA/DsbL [Campylobacter curvus]MDU6827982.1 thiol:disulfide interchange protein DsbA/DsbL [Campylobacter sp.]
MKTSILSKIVKILALVSFLSITASAAQEGVDYQVLQKPLNVPKNSVVKVFSYDCQHCYKFDKSVTKKLMSKLEGVRFIPYHLSSKGKLGETASKIFASLIAIDEANSTDLLSDESKFKKAKFAIYKARHDKNDDFDNGKDKARFIKLALDTAGVSQDEYEKSLASARAQELLNAWFDSYDVAVISGVPAFVVSGKYLINLDSATSIDKMAEIAKELLAK